MLKKIALAVLLCVAPFAHGGVSQGGGTQAAVTDPDAGLRQCVVEGQIRKIVGGQPACAADSTAGTAGAWPGLTSGDNNTAVMTCSGACSLSGNILAYTITPGGTIDGTDAGAAATRTGESFIQLPSHNTDCRLITDAIARELCIDEDDGKLWACAATDAGCNLPAEWVLVSAGRARVASAAFDADGMRTDGIQCVPATPVVVNGGPVEGGIRCADSASGVAYFKVNMPDSWDAQPVTVEVQAEHLDAVTTSNDQLGFNVSCLCRGDGGTVNATWGAAQDLDLVFATQYVEEQVVSAPITCNGAAAGATCRFRAVVDTDATDTLPGSHLVIGFKVEYGVTTVGD